MISYDLLIFWTTIKITSLQAIYLDVVNHQLFNRQPNTMWIQLSAVFPWVFTDKQANLVVYWCALCTVHCVHHQSNTTLSCVGFTRSINWCVIFYLTYTWGRTKRRNWIEQRIKSLNHAHILHDNQRLHLHCNWYKWTPTRKPHLRSDLNTFAPICSQSTWTQSHSHWKKWSEEEYRCIHKVNIKSCHNNVVLCYVCINQVKSNWILT